MMEEMNITEYENNNRIIEGDGVKRNDSKISFESSASNNILYLTSKLNLGTSEIKFRGSNSIVFLNSSNYPYKLKVEIFRDSAFYMGSNNYMNEVMHAILSERKHIFFGSNCTLALGIWINTSDVHLIYSVKTKERQNFSKSIFIGDHVWIGQNATILKGTNIASGSVIGASAVVAGKKISSNTAYAGNPAKKIAKGIFWDGGNVNNWTEEQTNKFSKLGSNIDIFTYKPEPEVYIPFDKIDSQLTNLKTSDDKMNYLIGISNNTAHNRFAF